DDKILSLYAKGMTTLEIVATFKEMYDADVSPTLISKVTDSVLEQVINKAVYLALGVNMEGQKELLGMWLSETEGAKFWLNVLTELQNRGVKDILIACVDGLKGFPDAINTTFPETQIQLCIVHMV
ncbi:IS256 family transposase, partial [Vibrio parahaemolyticus]|uniref:transposase n=1 Tax=Vibrio parahaemolyticus TaxID=670 RepID=UPI00111FB3EE